MNWQLPGFVLIFFMLVMAGHMHLGTEQNLWLGAWRNNRGYLLSGYKFKEASLK